MNLTSASLLPHTASQSVRESLAIRRDMRLHFLGIGGIGMSGLASICVDRGCLVSGCDAKLNSLAHRLLQRGVSISIGHDAKHLPQALDAVVYSSAVCSREPELLEARARGFHTMTRGELLAALASEKHLIAVAGAHGKTTTSAMAVELLLRTGWDPTAVIGGVMLSLGTNARSGSGAYLVAETDESDGSFLHLSPSVAIVTNIDREHLNFYQTLERLTAAFQQFVGQLKPGGTLIRCADDARVRHALECPRQLSYGLDANADLGASRVHLNGHGSGFHACYKGRDLGAFALQVPGRHNVLNALAIIGLGLTMEIPLVVIRDALANFQGTGRRFQVFRLPGDIWFVEDYAHHPAEIQATLAADATMGRHRLVVFQPHRFSRTQSLEREFVGCFDRADGVIVTDIYSAFEPPVPQVSGERLAGLIKDQGLPWVRYVPRPELRDFLRPFVQPHDTVFFLGAGDISELCHQLAGELRHRV